MEKKLIEIIAELCETEEIIEDPDIDLVENELLDSLTFVDLLVAIEEEFGVVIAPSAVSRDELNTANKIVEYVLDRKDQ